jgi:3-deoxy-D-manno-octulosonic-acid transferase
MNLAGIAVSPFLAIHKLRRYVAYRNIDEINPERWIIKPLNPAATAVARAKPGPHVMIVGASFGELLLMERVTEELEAKLGPVGISWVLRDRETIRQAAQFHPDRSLAYWPFDSVFPVARLLNSMRPDLMVMTERYRAANLVVGASRMGVSTVLINGRWRRRASVVEGIQRGYARKLLRSFQTLLFQSQTHLDSAKPLLDPEQVVKITGDLKYDLRQKELEPEAVASLEAWLGKGAPLLAAGSTDVPAEEEMVLTAFMAVRAQTPCRLLLAPRRPNRRDEILKMLERYGLKASFRTEPTEGADVFILDTMGELAWAYRYSVAAYVGGSFSGMGHNVIEPVGYGLPVTYGMRRGHFESMQKLCERHGVGFRVGDATELSGIWRRALLDREFADGVRAKGAALVEDQRGAMRTTIDALEAEIVAMRKRGGRAA